MLWKIWIEDFPDLFNSCECIFFSAAMLFFRVVETNLAFEKSGTAFWLYCTKNRMTVYQSYEDLLEVFLRSTSIQTKHQFPLCFIDPCVFAWFIEVITSLQTSYSFIILVTVQSTILYKISLSKCKWKISSMFSVLFALEFGTVQLILPEMISHFCCLPVANGCSELHQFLCNCFHLINGQCHELFDCEWIVFLARIFVINLHYFKALQVAVLPLSTPHLGENHFLLLHRAVHQDYHHFHDFSLPDNIYIIQNIIKW